MAIMMSRSRCLSNDSIFLSMLNRTKFMLNNECTLRTAAYDWQAVGTEDVA